MAVAERLYVVPDLRGRLGLLNSLLAAVHKDARSARTSVRIVLLGDLLGEGSSGKALLSFLHAHRSVNRLTVLGGWRERRMLAALDGDIEAISEWLEDGGEALLESFGVDPRAIFLRRLEAVLAQAVTCISPDLRSWMGALPSSHYSGDHCFVADNLDLSRYQPFGDDLPHGQSMLDATTVRRMASHLGVDQLTASDRIEQISALALEGRRQWSVHAYHVAAPRVRRALLLSGSSLPVQRDNDPADARPVDQSVPVLEARDKLRAILDTPRQPDRWFTGQHLPVGAAASAMVVAVFSWWMIPGAAPSRDNVVQSGPSHQNHRLGPATVPTAQVAMREAKRERADLEARDTRFVQEVPLRSARGTSISSHGGVLDIRAPASALVPADIAKAAIIAVPFASASPTPERRAENAVVGVRTISEAAPDTLASYGEPHEAKAELLANVRKRRLAAIDTIRALRFR